MKALFDKTQLEELVSYYELKDEKEIIEKAVSLLYCLYSFELEGWSLGLCKFEKDKNGNNVEPPWVNEAIPFCLETTLKTLNG